MGPGGIIFASIGSAKMQMMGKKLPEFVWLFFGHFLGRTMLEIWSMELKIQIIASSLLFGADLK
jgi:hypothetical protein